MAVCENCEFAVRIFFFDSVGVFCGITEEKFSTLCFIVAFGFKHGGAFGAMAGTACNHARHNKKANVSFADGHVGSHDKKYLQDTTYDGYLERFCRQVQVGPLQ